MTAAIFSVESDTQIALKGKIDRHNIPSIYPQIMAWNQSASQVELELQHVSRIDSAGMALIIQIIEHAKLRKCHIMLSFMPNQLRTLLSLSNAESLLHEHIKK
ncbi:STAS domain-containing protein [Vibrio maerlii]|uniref:STAS domain-containing protein n=1 Tax=Vibrio maerlii TaxID=2231648 RepID=UPI000E3D6D44|nr:STAS domain-containing protein [Vibrio maerlii]